MTASLRQLLLTESFDIKALAKKAYIDIVNEEPHSDALQVLQDALIEDGRTEEAEELADANTRAEYLRALIGMGVKPSIFRRDVLRIMTPGEAFDKAQKMGLEPAVVAWIEEAFQSVADHQDNYDSDSYEEGGSGVGEQGRIAFGQSWEYQYEELAQAMGLDPYSEEANPQLQRVWNTFFQE